MQSSSTCGGGDEEYDLRMESSFSTLLDKTSPPPSSLQPRRVIRSTSVVNNHNSHMLDPLSNYLGPIQRSQQNFDRKWSKVVRSEPNQSDLASMMPSSIPSSCSHNEQVSFSSLGQTSSGVGVSLGHATFPTLHHSSMPPPHESASRGLLFSEDQGYNDNKNMVRNPKKRSRASRRAPTTVLTTNTTNFRAMVQEFTGIPAPPFTSLPFQRTRLDMLGSSSTIRSLDTPQPQPPYLLHPFPPSSSTSSIPISMLDSNNSHTLLGSNHSTSNPSSNPPQFMMNNMHNNPILSFQSILQGQQAQLNTKYPLGYSSKTQPAFETSNTSVDNSHFKTSVFDEIGLNHAHVNNMISSSPVAALSSRVNNSNMGNPSSPLEWVQRTGTTLISCNNNNNDGGDNHGNCTSNNLHGEKGPECNVAARSEGMVESWINCSSD
ncbi:hypothetical protein TanjilG_08593 [Lupinus angustifolius]|uniref:VQ domain-containing protein n=2 Tax=Lupinus angustifolius TaxID=3871 RepID=A0A4P1RPZ0_LUPAN|nr:hypothetical protein TanjilG_08593 [Lupinus angustifolius]